MKKILISTVAIFLALLTQSNAQNSSDYYEIYAIDAPAEKPKKDILSINKKNSQLSNNQKEFNEFNDTRSFYSGSQNEKIAPKKYNEFSNSESFYSNNQNQQIAPKNLVKEKIKTSTEITESEEVTAVRRKSKSRTVGNYIGIDFINTYLRYRNYGYGNTNSEISNISDPTLPKYKNSFGLKYSYALNYRGIFLAPELFFEYNNIKKYFDGDNSSTSEFNERLPSNYGYKFLKIHRTYGAKINLGYDVTANFAPYLFAGISKIYYSDLNSVYPAHLRDSVTTQTGTDPFKIIHKSQSVPFFGFGGKIKLSERIALNAEYLIYDFMAKTNSYKNKDYSESISRTDSTDMRVALRVTKVGLTYNF